MIDESALILVAILPSIRDFDIARMLGWYRIPLKSAPKMLFVDYIAFYEPKAVTKTEFGLVKVYAEVRGHELVRRVDLFRDEKDHPHAQEEYFKISVGPLQTIDPPIVANEWKRLTFLYTTGRQFMGATSLNDLVVRSSERNQLWQMICERAATRTGYNQPDALAFDIPPDMLPFLGMIASRQ
jgi:hypothetical protein